MDAARISPTTIAVAWGKPMRRARAGFCRALVKGRDGLPPRCSRCSLHLRQSGAIGTPRQLVHLLGLNPLFRAHARALLLPALIYGAQAPVGAFTRRANWLATHYYKD